MSTYLVTPPYGPLLYHRWACRAFECGDGGGGTGAERAEVRSEATGHIQATGHDVTIIDGTLEHLYPVATTADSAVRS